MTLVPSTVRRLRSLEMLCGFLAILLTCGILYAKLVRSSMAARAANEPLMYGYFGPMTPEEAERAKQLAPGQDYVHVLGP